MIGIERKVTLEALHAVEQENRDQREGQERDGVGGPALFSVASHAGGLVYESLDRTEEAVAGSLFVLEDLGHVVAEKGRRDDQEDDKDDDLYGVLGHQSFSGEMRA